MQLNLIARGRGDVDLIYMAQGGLFYVGSIGFSSKAKIRYRCEFVTLETIDTSEGRTPFCGVFLETSLHFHIIKALPNENRRLFRS
jgi:hypothetical protein